MKSEIDQSAKAEEQGISAPLSYLDRDELNQFLTLIRDSYPKADMAALFLEQNCQQPTVSIPSITNLRDVLSHLSTFLRPELTPEKRKEQLTSAKEHLRRSIHEPYEITYLDSLTLFIKLYRKYVEELLPAKNEHPFLSSAPTRANVDARLEDILKLAAEGRIAKGNNQWNSSWEEGTACLIKALDKLKELVHEIEEHLYKFQQVSRETDLKMKLADAERTIEDNQRHNIHWHRLGIGTALLIFLLSAFEFHIKDHIMHAWDAIHLLIRH